MIGPEAAATHDLDNINKGRDHLRNSLAQIPYEQRLSAAQLEVMQGQSGQAMKRVAFKWDKKVYSPGSPSTGSKGRMMYYKDGKVVAQTREPSTIRDDMLNQAEQGLGKQYRHRLQRETGGDLRKMATRLEQDLPPKPDGNGNSNDDNYGNGVGDGGTI